MKKVLLLLCVFAVSMVANATVASITIEYLPEAAQDVELQKLGRIEFKADNMLVVAKDGSVILTKAIKDVKKIVINKDKTAVEEVGMKNAMMVYPNPTMESLYVDGLKEGDVVRVYSLDGMMIMSQKLASDRAMLDVTSLNAGTYLIQANNNIVKFIKK